jgi:hypothetical protein
VIDENNLQDEKHDEPRISISQGIIIANEVEKL